MASLMIAGHAALAAEPENGPESKSDFEPILPAPIPRARWSEDWSTFYDPKYENLTLPFKKVSLNADGTNYVSFGGEFRVTYELYDPADRGLSDTGTQDVVMNRLAAHADWHLGSRVRVFAQLGNAAATDRDGGKKPGDESDPNIWQLFADVRFQVGDGDRVDVRVGRQFIEKADWFIGAGEARGLRQYYDGIRSAWLDERFAKFDIFAAEFVDAATGSFDMSGTGEYLWGTAAQFRPDALGGAEVSALYFGWDLKDRQFEQGGGAFNDERRHTLLAWLNKPQSATNRWSFDYYLGYQFGSYDDTNNSDISAWSAFGQVRYDIYPRINSPFVGLKTSYFSGDGDPGDDKLTTFYNPVFVTVYFSYARDIQPFNLVHVQPNVGYRFSEKLQTTLSTDFLWRESRDDAFYTTSGGITIGAAASNARYIGTQTQISMNWKPTRGIVATMHLVRFWAGEFVEEGGGEDQTYFRVELSYLF